MIIFTPPPRLHFHFGLIIFWNLTRKHVITVLKDTNICHICLNKFSIKSDIYTSVHIQACLYTGIEQHAQPSYMVYTYTCRQSFEVLLALHVICPMNPLSFDILLDLYKVHSYQHLNIHCSDLIKNSVYDV